MMVKSTASALSTAASLTKSIFTSITNRIFIELISNQVQPRSTTRPQEYCGRALVVTGDLIRKLIREYC